MVAKRKTKGAYMISAVAEMYEIHPQTLRLYEREGLLKPSRPRGATRALHGRGPGAAGVHPEPGAGLGREYRRHRHYSANAGADGGDEPADAELCGVCADGDAGAVPAGLAGGGAAIVAIRRSAAVARQAAPRKP